MYYALKAGRKIPYTEFASHHTTPIIVVSYSYMHAIQRYHPKEFLLRLGISTVNLGTILSHSNVAQPLFFQSNNHQTKKKRYCIVSLCKTILLAKSALIEIHSKNAVLHIFAVFVLNILPSPVCLHLNGYHYTPSFQTIIKYTGKILTNFYK